MVFDRYTSFSNLLREVDMDFWVDMGIAVLRRLLKDRRSVSTYFEGLAKLHIQLEELYDRSADYRAAFALLKGAVDAQPDAKR